MNLAIFRRALFVVALTLVTIRSANAAEVEVTIDNFTFKPPQVTVKAGDTIVWINHDDIPHTVTSKTMAFRSKPLDSADKFSFTFTTSGTFIYFCSLHPHMTGSVVVEADKSK